MLASRYGRRAVAARSCYTFHLKAYQPDISNLQPPCTLAFYSDDFAGLLQVTGFTDKPRGMKIRYKLVQDQTALAMQRGELIAGSVADATEATTRPPVPGFAIRLVAAAGDAQVQVDELDDPQESGQKLRVLREVLLDESGIASAAVERPEPAAAPPNAIRINFTPAGAASLARVTADHLGEQLAIVLDGHVLSAPRIQARITGGQAMISFGPGTPPERIAQIAKALNALAGKGAITPATQPGDPR